jgi:chromate transporter
MVETGLAPIAAGLVLAGAVSILRSEPGGLLAWTTALSIAAVRMWLPVLHPLWLLSIGALVFAVAEVFG